MQELKIIAEEFEFVVGVDPHARTHTSVQRLPSPHSEASRHARPPPATPPGTGSTGGPSAQQGLRRHRPHTHELRHRNQGLRDAQPGNREIKPGDPPEPQTLRLPLLLPPAPNHHGLTEPIEESFWVDVPRQISSSPAQNLILLLQQAVALLQLPHLGRLGRCRASSRISADSAAAGPAPESLRSVMAIHRFNVVTESLPGTATALSRSAVPDAVRLPTARERSSPGRQRHLHLDPSQQAARGAAVQGPKPRPHTGDAHAHRAAVRRVLDYHPDEGPVSSSSARAFPAGTLS
jgi:hypothetical protein